ncbi:MAG: hypothetical protein ACQER9_03630 [Nanobdellota archaeon]
MEVLSEMKEEMLGRKRLTYKMEQKSVTPARSVLQKKIADMNKADPKLVVVNKIEGKYGTNEFIIDAEIYNNKESYDKCVPQSMVKKSEIKEPEKPAEGDSENKDEASQKEADNNQEDKSSSEGKETEQKGE